MHDIQATKQVRKLPGPKTAERKALDWNVFDHALTIEYDRSHKGHEVGDAPVETLASVQAPRALRVLAKEAQSCAPKTGDAAASSGALAAAASS
ncbi:hypothetical protein CYMTET_41803 [Cymbomonas tetramitiformis]|uniref:Uncharacterized protein n=1 Tax=Cymbomonas tetramitiformis TaxID=36881 RepID=A0AAE0F1V2_9CHLO|nr:hypothetical protein CYMTET_41803 [Cymbomonas tetramitiformis]